MGAAGLPSRILAAALGSCWTYGGTAIAPGQVPPALMRSRYRVGAAHRRDAGLRRGGRPIGHSWSPALHNAALQALGIDAVYLPFEAQDIDDLLAAAAAFGVRGLSVTAPFKLDALARAVEADPVARRLGAPTRYAGRRPAGRRATPTSTASCIRSRSRLPLAGARASCWCRRRGARGGRRPHAAGARVDRARASS